MKLLKFYLFSFFEGFVPVYPVYLIMFTERGFSLMDVSILMMFWALPVVILELPTGFLADLWSKKKMMVIGMVLKALGFFLWLVSGSFLFAVLGFFCWAVQESFCSGSRQALLYEAVTHENVSISYEKAAGICSMIEMAGIAFAMITGGILYAYSPTLTLLASSAAALISAFIGLSLKEYKN
ncbi:MAG TPA: MFS transporter, partial [Treponemataceae bacterium]|nr:MFS transporter [Treponemataceae bacterium]